MTPCKPINILTEIFQFPPVCVCIYHGPAWCCVYLTDKSWPCHVTSHQWAAPPIGWWLVSPGLVTSFHVVISGHETDHEYISLSTTATGNVGNIQWCCHDHGLYWVLRWTSSLSPALPTSPGGKSNSSFSVVDSCTVSVNIWTSSRNLYNFHIHNNYLYQCICDSFKYEIEEMCWGSVPFSFP